ncbi:MAG: hypothetical protein A2Y17_12250 [Clostridiales bacterium GWF2_38_85]|nr:MAG: hypothetical protein A2Y17_12250 [Clostridiales bacterium GWF2_38_85]
MPKEKQTKEPLSIDKRIAAEVRKIKPLFKNLGKDKARFIDKIIYQLATVQVTLDRLAEAINNGDILENFEQGSQKFKRENPALKSYNTTIKSYATLSKQLIDLLPNDDLEKAGQALMSFATKPQIPKK